MSRAATGDTVVLKASSNVYTGLLIAATVAVGLALAVLFIRSTVLLPAGTSLF
jgi:hypothetical protein